MTWPILGITLFLPLLGSAVLALIPASRTMAVRTVGIAFAAATFALSLVMLVSFYATPKVGSAVLGGSVHGRSLAHVASPITFQFQEQLSWLGSTRALGQFRQALNQGNNGVNQAFAPPINFSFHIGVDGLAVWMVALTGLLFLLAAVALSRREDRPRSFLILMGLAETGVIGVLVSLDLVLFYFFWEAALIPLYFQLLGWGGPRRGAAALKFIIYTVAGSLFMLLAILGLYFITGAETGVYTFDVPTQIAMATQVIGQHPTSLTIFGHVFTFLTPEQWLFLAFALAFAIKVPLVPFHTWLPDAYGSGTTPFLIFFAGIVSKLGAFGLIRYNLALFPQASHFFQPVMLALGVTSILYGGLMALGQRDIRQIVAYSSISHLGFVVLGIFALNVDGLGGAIVQMVNHGIIVAGLFLCVGMLEVRFGTRDLGRMGGLARPMPIMAGMFLVLVLAGMGMPLMNSFVGEFLILLGVFQVSPAWAVAASLGVVIACWYMLRLYQGLTQGAVRIPGTGGEERRAGGSVSGGGVRDLRALEIALLAPLVAVCIGVGIYPSPIISTIRFNASQYMRLDGRGPQALMPTLGLGVASSSAPQPPGGGSAP